MDVDIKRALQRIAQTRVQRCIRGALDAGATAAYDVLAKYPPQEQGRKNPPQTQRQRRYLMWLARQGKIPYRRTGNLRQKLLIVKPANDRREVKNTASYYPYVWGSSDRAQARIHAGVWPTRRDAIAAVERETVRALRALLRREGIVQ